MSIIVSCSACNVRLTLGDDRAGDRLECPQCDATIKVPLPAHPPTRTPALPPASGARARPVLSLEPEPDRRADRRVLAGIIAGVAALLLVGVAVTVLAFRKPAETARAAPDPAPPTVVAPVAPPPPKPAVVVTPPKPVPVIPPPKTEPPPVSVPPHLLAPQFNAQFLGSQGKGRRFCVIADTSGSMGVAKLADLKTQLLKTLADLNQEGEFYVYSFNTTAEAMPHPDWLKGGAPEVRGVRSWVAALKAKGGTRPEPAFEAAFKLTPPPDVIFFMTDGLIPPTVPARVAALNGTPPKVVVNTIMFTAKGEIVPKGEERAEELLKQIAEKSGGTFTRYVAKD